MSMDVIVECAHCGSELSDQNVTYNVSPIFYRSMRAAGVHGGIRGLDGMPGDVAAPLCRAALAFTQRWDERLSELEPPNRWGSIRCVYRVLRSVVRHGKAGTVVRVS